jgi:hypothetical protein
VREEFVLACCQHCSLRRDPPERRRKQPSPVGIEQHRSVVVGEYAGIRERGVRLIDAARASDPRR